MALRWYITEARWHGTFRNRTYKSLETKHFIKEKDTAWFVKFCVPRCKHCKNLGTLWDDLEKAIEGTDEIEIGEVDCGLRDVDSLKNFVLEEADKAATNVQAQQLDSDREL
ncbi:protein disulfide-isomerase 5-1-like [Arachis hypogaea]|uniref:protein disulfide-isomerase 5-1-like n=1 Tax=Arachis hypogaea TaxID=3818 RepID=UPI000DED2AC9|nr:protein disulfide-isomerase 5-1-like [Arachis hypogaea]